MNTNVARTLLWRQRHLALVSSRGSGGGSFQTPNFHEIASRRITSTSRSSASAKKPPKDAPPPLPPSSRSSAAASSSSKKKQQHTSPVEAKKRYLESKKRTEEFLQDPQKKINQLNSEIDQVRERLEREVYNKTVWQRLTYPLKRKQHSLINMIAAMFAYVLAFQLHLKRQANQKLQDELEEQAQKQEELKTLLRSLLEDGNIQGMAIAAADEMTMEGTDTRASSTAWPWSAPLRQTDSTSDSSTISQSQIDAVAQALRRKLEERIGDEGLDDDAKKERGIERIWQQNQKSLEEQPSLLGDSDESRGDDDDMAGLLALAEEVSKDEGSASKSSKRKRVIDM